MQLNRVLSIPFMYCFISGEAMYNYRPAFETRLRESKMEALIS